MTLHYIYSIGRHFCPK
uniref:Uncharacterized protein n=1 Tax=Anguilla anguilla TaxID=7936 RepID=A0A0E9RF47_ANGAN